MASKVKINNGKIMDGGKQVGMIKNGSIYDRNSTSSTYLLAMTKNNVIYSANNPNSGHCIGRLYSGAIYNKDSTSTSYRIGKIRDAERVISGRCSDQVLAAVYILMKSGQL